MLEKPKPGLIGAIGSLAARLIGKAPPVNFCQQVYTQPDLEIRSMSPGEEHWYVTRWILPNYEQFKKEGYLPEIPKWLAEKLGTDTTENLVQLFSSDTEYRDWFRSNQTKCSSETEHVVNKLEDLYNLAWQSFRKWNNEGWFAVHDKYLLLISDWGLEGSYLSHNANSPWANSKIGVSFFQNIKADSKGSSDYMATIPIHEIVHLGIEQTIVQKYNLSQDQKERVVDMLCSDCLSNHEYSMQKRGDRSVDLFVDNYLSGNSRSLAVDMEAFKRSMK